MRERERARERSPLESSQFKSTRVGVETVALTVERAHLSMPVCVLQTNTHTHTLTFTFAFTLMQA